MRVFIAVLAAWFAAPSLGTASAAGFSDAICPEATQYVVAVGKLSKDDPPQTVYTAAQNAVDAYARCSKEKLSNGFREPQHYADVRAGGLAVVAARALIALGRSDEARRELLAYRPLVQQVVDWDSETETPYSAYGGRMQDDEKVSRTNADRGSSGNGRRPSVYKASAKDVVAAIDAELAKLGPAPAAH